jgi:adenylate cyclase class 2
MNKEIECRFLEIYKDALIKKLIELGAEDQGEVMLEETIVYDKDLKFLEERRFVRLRKSGDTIKLTYKEHTHLAVDGAVEIEIEISDMKKAEAILEKIGLIAYRHQQKKRHTLILNDVTFDIDTWPKIPTYVELEGKSEDALKKMVELIGYDWKNVEFRDARRVIEEVYKIPVGKLKWFMFERVE